MADPSKPIEAVKAADLSEVELDRVAGGIIGDIACQDARQTAQTEIEAASANASAAYQLRKSVNDHWPTR